MPQRRVVPQPPRGPGDYRSVAAALQRGASTFEPRLLDPARIQTAPSVRSCSTQPSHFPGMIGSKLRAHVTKLRFPGDSTWSVGEGSMKTALVLVAGIVLGVLGTASAGWLYVNHMTAAAAGKTVAIPLDAKTRVEKSRLDYREANDDYGWWLALTEGVLWTVDVDPPAKTR